LNKGDAGRRQVYNLAKFIRKAAPIVAHNVAHN